MEPTEPTPWRRRLLFVLGGEIAFGVLTGAFAWTHIPTCLPADGRLIAPMDAETTLRVSLVGYGVVAGMAALLVAGIVFGVMWYRSEGTVTSLIEVGSTLAVAVLIALIGIGATWLPDTPWCQLKPSF